MTDLAHAYAQLSSFLNDYGKYGMGPELLRLVEIMEMEAQEASDVTHPGRATDYILFDNRGDALNLSYSRLADDAQTLVLQHWVNGEIIASGEWNCAAPAPTQ